MSSFAVEHCRKVREGYAEFDVHMRSGQLIVGDRFDCLDGMGRHVRFHVRKVEEKMSATCIECDGPITFDDQFARFHHRDETIPTGAPRFAHADTHAAADRR